MRSVFIVLAGALVVAFCVAAILLIVGYQPAPNPNFTNIQLPTLDTP